MKGSTTCGGVDYQPPLDLEVEERTKKGATQLRGD